MRQIGWLCSVVDMVQGRREHTHSHTLQGTTMPSAGIKVSLVRQFIQTVKAALGQATVFVFETEDTLDLPD